MFICELVHSLLIFRSWQKCLGNGSATPSRLYPCIEKVRYCENTNGAKRIFKSPEKRVVIDHAKLLSVNVPHPLACTKALCR